jgi:N-carbamoylputrescine amidase
MAAVSVRVAAIQLESRLGDVAATLDHATGLVESAAAQGAQLIVLPELFNCGYVGNEDIWRLAERPDGATVRWLEQMARRFDVYIGGGHPEFAGSDVLNVFTLAAPGGMIAGRARKSEAEAYVFRRGHGVHVIDTALGRVGVGICADNQVGRLLRLMQDRSVDLMLMPHAWPTPTSVTRLVSEADVADQRHKVAELPLIYARHLGVPAILVNQVGRMAPMAGLLGRLMDPAVFQLQGRSRIVDSDGSVAGALDDGEGVLVRDVILDSARKVRLTPSTYGRWLTRGNVVARRVIIPTEIVLGMTSYRLHAGRRRAAAAASLALDTQAPATIGIERAG